MKKATKKNRKYLIGSGKINSAYKLFRHVLSMNHRNPCSPITVVRVRYCGRTKIINVG